MNWIRKLRDELESKQASKPKKEEERALSSDLESVLITGRWIKAKHLLL